MFSLTLYIEQQLYPLVKSSIHWILNLNQRNRTWNKCSKSKKKLQLRIVGTYVCTWIAERGGDMKKTRILLKWPTTKCSKRLWGNVTCNITNIELTANRFMQINIISSLGNSQPPAANMTKPNKTIHVIIIW